MIIEINDIHTFYGTSHILFGISMEIEEGETVCLLGRNGAGKTTTLRSIMGLTPPRSGSIKFKGKEITGEPAYAISRQGIGFVPEDRRIFPSLTVREQLDVAKKAGVGNWTVEKVYELFPHLKKLEKHMGNQLSGGEQQMLTIARTLMGNPELLLMDEPSEGLAPLVVDDLMEQMRKLKKEKITLLFSEMGLGFAIELSDRAYVIDKGQIQWNGTCSELKKDEELKRKYLAV
ncbi:MAG: ABC transporter ATP-binding protein [Deltaproteobacteria bacterium]|nr:ABC transporter ATP-binding protein [Deltaproteobacteria bacterium]